VIKSRELKSARITGIGHYLPEKILTNADFEKMVDTSDEWILTRSGIRERHITAENEFSSDMAFEASKMALADAGVDPKDLDMIIVATVTPDMPLPSTGCLLQEMLGAKKAAAFDVSAACSGFIYGLSVGSSMIESGKAKKVLAIGVETLSSITDYTDRTTCVLFGDGCGAVVLEEGEPGEGVLSTFMQSDGGEKELLYITAGGSKTPLTTESIEARDYCIRMKGDGLFKYAVKSMVNAARHTLKEAGFGTEDVTYLIPHQANIRIIESVRKRLKLEKDQVVVNIDHVGNTSSASIPIALSELKQGGTLKKDDLVIMVAFGGGLTWGAALIKY
jgi:3-oxoacyl-[acyl-carrier-protein] synthase-3